MNFIEIVSLLKIHSGDWCIAQTCISWWTLISPMRGPHIHLILITRWIKTSIYLSVVTDPFLHNCDLLLFDHVLVSQLNLGGLHISLLFQVNYWVSIPQHQVLQLCLKLEHLWNLLKHDFINRWYIRGRIRHMDFYFYLGFA